MLIDSIFEKLLIRKMKFAHKFIVVYDWIMRKARLETFLHFSKEHMKVRELKNILNRWEVITKEENPHYKNKKFIGDYGFSRLEDADDDEIAHHYSVEIFPEDCRKDIYLRYCGSDPIEETLKGGESEDIFSQKYQHHRWELQEYERLHKKFGQK